MNICLNPRTSPKFTPNRLHGPPLHVFRFHIGHKECSFSVRISFGTFENCSFYHFSEVWRIFRKKVYIWRSAHVFYTIETKVLSALWDNISGFYLVLKVSLVSCRKLVSACKIVRCFNVDGDSDQQQQCKMKVSEVLWYYSAIPWLDWCVMRRQ